MRVLHKTLTLPRPSTIEADRINRWIWVETVLVIAGAVLLASFCPLPLFMIMLSVLLLIPGFGIALISYLRNEPREVAVLTHWDQAGILVFLGFAVALLSEPAEFLTYLEEAKK